MKKQKPFELLGETIAPGKTARITLELAKLHTNTPIQIPVIVSHATKVEKEFAPIAEILENNQAQYIDVIDKNTGDRYPMSLQDFYLPDIDTSIYAIGDTILRLDESLTDINLKDFILAQEQILLIFS